ncbi:MAG: cupin domain-containing protein [Bacteroidales bacterium]|nr:cupin domain-containing protein [Bacteroidales bacterium]MBN2758416.1 cupin domain-containing protein [Bacteroidales bacterium]
MKNLMNLYENADWEKAEGYPKGTFKKDLRDDKFGKTILLKLPENFQMKPHSHITTEQHLVLEGEYVSSGKTYKSGCYQIFNPGDEHGPFESKKGALILVIWDVLTK